MTDKRMDEHRRRQSAKKFLKEKQELEVTCYGDNIKKVLKTQAASIKA